MTVPFIEEHLRALRLPTMLGQYKRLAQGKQERISYLGELAGLELAKRHENGVRKRIIAAKFPVIKTVESFDFALQPELPRRQFSDLLDCTFIDQRQNVIFIGSTGVGKTHLLSAIGIAACTNGYRVLFSTAAEFYDLGQIQWDGQYMAVTDTSFDTVSRITFVVRSGSGFAGIPGEWNGTVVGVTTLDKCGYDEAWSSWIYDGSIVVACTLDSPYQNQDKGRILIWNYPQGGHRVKRIAKYETRPNLPDGVTISVSPSK